jgi:hypothetical protein
MKRCSNGCQMFVTMAETGLFVSQILVSSPLFGGTPSPSPVMFACSSRLLLQNRKFLKSGSSIDEMRIGTSIR